MLTPAFNGPHQLSRFDVIPAAPSDPAMGGKKKKIEPDHQLRKAFLFNKLLSKYMI